MSTISDPVWETGTAFLVSGGAFLLLISDLMLAWNKFVSPTKFGSLSVIAAYQLGQILLTAGVLRHFA